ncbi:peroxisomal acyl-coenzyme A oxidase 2-like isoform X2 [Clavelina lepadiformis]|uniref:peroxisomal acyl-coenzyme A oxidase 2-like isoform X2 n=1 Tax=Clavelina lepadiformis TaxID=159417 RepID=UPI004042B4C4
MKKVLIYLLFQFLLSVEFISVSENVIANDTSMQHRNLNHMTREERFSEAMRRTLYALKVLLPREGWTPVGPEMKYLARAIKEFTFIIHAGVFIPCIMSYGTNEQIAKWFPLAADFRIIGTYAQTELGHGSFLRGLETIATYDRANQEFIINCPKITAMKWWPGDMGKSANHVLLMAELVIDGKKYGMHGFMVQIRDLTTHEPLPGVTVGDIGAKLSFESVDNGFLYLQNVRIPRENLLSKLSEVHPDGTYIKKGNQRLMYGSMVRVRVNLIAHEIVMPLAKACTIAVRYSAVRRQGLINPSKEEVPVLDYVAQQHKLLPQVATVFMAHFAAKQLVKMHHDYSLEVEKGNTSQLPELHALSAGMKACLSEQGAAGAEIVRRACGGHGYSCGSGLPFIVNRMLATCTYEGENTVMQLQCARYLIKCADQAKKDKLTGSVWYLSDFSNMSCTAQTFGDLQEPSVLVKLHERRAKCAVQHAGKKMQNMVKNGTPAHDAWNMMATLLINAARAHIMQYVVGTSVTYISELSCSASLKKILTQLCALYALHNINSNCGDFVKFGCLTSAQCDLAQEAEFNLLKQLRPDAVGIVDSFDFTDDILQSCLGAYDGNVYERLFEWAKQAPMNKTEVHQDSYQYLQPYLHEGRDVLEGRGRNSKL